MCGYLSACPAHHLLSIKDTPPGHLYVLNYNKSPLYLNLTALSPSLKFSHCTRLCTVISPVSSFIFLYHATLFSVSLLILFDPTSLSSWGKSRVDKWILLNAPRELTLCMQCIVGHKSRLEAANMASYAITFTLQCWLKCHSALSTLSFRVLLCSIVLVPLNHLALQSFVQALVVRSFPLRWRPDGYKHFAFRR